MKKVIACALVIALCFVAVFTGTVSAAAVGSITYTVTGSGYEPGAKDSYVTAVVSFKNTDGHPFVAGVFDLNASSIGLKLTDASVSGFVFAGESALEQPQISFSISKDRVLFASFTNSAVADITPLNQIDLLLTFSVVGKPLSEYAAGTTWALALSNIDITDEDENTYSVSEVAADRVNIHVHNFPAAPKEADIETVSCGVANCGVTKTYVNKAASAFVTHNDAIPVNMANVTFTNKGDVILNALLPKTEADNGTYGIDVDGGDNVYFVYTYNVDGGTQKSGVATPDVITVKGVDYYAFHCLAENGIGRVSDGLIGNFFVESAGNLSISGRFGYSILSWVVDIIDNSSDADEVAYAKALYDYAKATATALAEIDGKDNKTGAYTRAYYNVGGFTDTADWTTLTTGTNYKATTNGTTDNTWNVAGISVTTGFKPSMNIKFRGNAKGVDLETDYPDGYITIKIKNGDDLVYMKEVGVDNLIDNTFVLSDVPTKYLINNIEIGVENSSKTASGKIVYYSYGRYAAALTVGTKADAPVFKYMMDYAKKLSVAFHG